MTDTTTDPFSGPAEGGDSLPLEELLGNLLLFTVHSQEKGVDTSFGPKDPVRCDVAALDGDHKGDTWENTFIFPKVLIGQLATKVGGMVLGRLSQGNAKPGQKPPWILSDPTDDDKQTARKYLEYVASQQPPADEPF